MSSITKNIKGGVPQPYPLPQTPPPTRDMTSIGKVPITPGQPPIDTSKIPWPWH